MKRIKTLLLLAGLMIMAGKGFSQTFSYTVQVNPGSCYTDSTGGGINVMVDTLALVTPPQTGTITVGNNGYTYCAPPAFIGTDQATFYFCYSGGTFPICDTLYVTFIVQPANCLILSLTQDTLICVGGNRSYSVTVSGTAPYTYLWSDGSTSSSACELNPGQGTCVTVTDATGCTATTCTGNNGCTLPVTISNSSPCAGPMPGLSALASGGSAPYTYYWSNGQIGEFICNLTSGTYYVSVVDAAGCVGSAYYTVGGGGNGSCYFIANRTNPFLNTVYDFYSFGDTVGGNTVIWDFGDGSVGTGTNITHTFGICGLFHVQMFMYNSSTQDSCYYSQYIDVCDSNNYYPACQAYFTWYYNSNNSQFQFADYSPYQNTAVMWDFGDGTSSTQANPTHTYNSIGTFNVCLTVTGANGCTSTYCENVSNVPVQDMEGFLFHQTTVTPGFPVWVYLGYFNTGTTLMSGTVEYRYPAGTTFNSSTPSPISHDAANRLLTFSYSNMMPNTSSYVDVTLDAPVGLPLGSLVGDTVWVNPIAGDATPSNNVSFIADSVVGSWDPNDKAVSPKGHGEEGEIPVNTEDLSYRIRFQNTGNAPAQQVVIRDVLSNNIDLSTVMVTGASHDHGVQLIGSELVVSFLNINLPDSGADYEASQGYITVYAKLKPSLTAGTKIFNTAAIYFDFNDPVITNTVVNTLKTDATGIDEIASLEFGLVPNPAKNQVMIAGQFEKNADYKVIDGLGQVVLSGEINALQNKLNIEPLSNGIYFVKVNSGTQTGVQRLVVAK